MRTTFVSALLVAGFMAGTALAQPAKHAGAASKDYETAMQSMHQAMMKANDSDPDRAFALKMIEHHRGGIAMSDVLQRHGDDAELKGMARKSSDMQKKEISELQAWLDRHGGRTPRP